MDEEPQDDGARLTQLADFWLYEHLLSLPKSIATDEIINHLGSKYPFRHGEGASLPAPISARLFLRHLREPPQLPITDWEEQLQLLGLMCQLSCKCEQFRSRQAAAAMHPPSELMVEVLMQLLCTRADPAFAELDEQGEQQQPLTSAGVAAAAEELLENADVDYLQDDEQLQNRLSLLEQLLRGRLEARKLQKHLREAFPAAAVEEHLREYAEKAWAALGDTSLQRYQAEVLSGSLPFDPMQHFATLAPVATQAAFEDVTVLDDAAEASQQQQQRQQQRTRGSKPVPLLGEATAPVLGAEDLEPPGSSQGRRAGRGSRLQQAAAGASPQPKASPMARASPQQARSSPAAAAAAAAAGADDVGKPGRRGRAPSNKAVQEAAPAAHPTRKQLQLLPSNAAAAAAAGADRPEAEGGSRKGRKSRRQQQEEAEVIESEPPAAAADLAAAAAAGSGGRRRGRRASPPAAAAAEAGSDEEQQAADGLDLLAAAGAAQEGGAKKGLGSAFQNFLNKPLDSLAGLAAAVRGSPAAGSGGVSGGPKERKMCGAPTQGVKGKTVPWESPFGGSIDSPKEDSPKGKVGKSPAAAAAAGPHSRAAVEARKRKRAQQAAAGGGQQKGPLAAARAAGAARAPDSGNTEYQDAEEEAGQSEESQELPAAAAAAGKQRGQGKGSRQSPRHKLHKQQQQRVSPQRRGAAAAAAAAGGGDDSSVDDPESDDAFNYDGASDEEGGGGGQQQQRRRQGRPSSKQQHRKRQAGAASGGRARGAGAAFDDDFDVAHAALEGYKRRRKIRYWSADEEALLIQLVAQHGEGQWALIHQLGGDGFDNRTQVDLKDKWRNLKKRGAVSEDWS